MENIEKKIMEMVTADRKNSEKDRKDAEKAYRFFFDNLNEQDTSTSSKEALARLLEAKIASNNASIEASKILVALLKEGNKKNELDIKAGQFGAAMDNINLSALAESLDEE